MAATDFGSTVSSARNRHSGPGRLNAGPLDGVQNVAGKGSAQAENGRERFVDPPQLLVCEMPDQFAQPSGVHGSALLDEDAGSFPLDLSLRSERRWSGAPRRGSDDDDRPGQELVRLNYHREAVAVLFVVHTLEQPKAVNITSKHEVLPSTPQQPASPPDPHRQPRGRLPRPPAPGCGGGAEPR